MSCHAQPKRPELSWVCARARSSYLPRPAVRETGPGRVAASSYTSALGPRTSTMYEYGLLALASHVAPLLLFGLRTEEEHGGGCQCLSVAHRTAVNLVSK